MFMLILSPIPLDPSNAASEWQAGSLGIELQEINGVLTTREACSTPQREHLELILIKSLYKNMTYIFNQIYSSGTNYFN